MQSIFFLSFLCKNRKLTEFLCEHAWQHCLGEKKREKDKQRKRQFQRKRCIMQGPDVLMHDLSFSFSFLSFYVFNMFSGILFSFFQSVLFVLFIFSFSFLVCFSLFYSTTCSKNCTCVVIVTKERERENKKEPLK